MHERLIHSRQMSDPVPPEPEAQPPQPPQPPPEPEAQPPQPPADSGSQLGGARVPPQPTHTWGAERPAFARQRTVAAR